MLLNAHTTVMHNGKPLVIAGVTDRAAANFDQPLPDIDRALKDAPADAPVILMSHRLLGRGGEQCGKRGGSPAFGAHARRANSRYALHGEMGQ